MSNLCPGAIAPLPFWLAPVDLRLPRGARGERPVWLKLSQAQARIALAVPGTRLMSGGVACAWDAAEGVASRLGSGTSGPPAWDPAVEPPGLFRYTSLGLAVKLRPYQTDAAAFLAQRAMALVADPPRAGKTLSAIAAAVAAGYRRVLVLCPALAKLVWANEVARWTGDAALVLYGLAATHVRRYCLACAGRGIDATGTRCAVCSRGTGSTPVAGAGVDADTADDDAVATRAKRLAVADALHEARWVVCNYDLLVPRIATDAAGRCLGLRTDLAGWVETLAQIPFDLIIADEAHLLRGRAREAHRRGLARRDRALMVARHVHAAWAVTATPFWGYVADGWGLLDWLTDGLFGSPWDFDRAYAGGHLTGDPSRGVPGHWEAKERTATPELAQRLSHLMIKRDRKEIQPYLPAKQRIVRRIETPPVQARLDRSLSASRGVAQALAATVQVKLPFAMDAATDEMMLGEKVVVFSYLRRHAESAAKALQHAINTGPKASALKAKNPCVWLAHGEAAPDARFKLAQAFRDWPGSAAFCATMDAVPGMVSLKGASSVHFLELHHNPGLLLQCEDRPYEEGTNGLSVVYWIAAGTADDYAMARLLPKLETLEAVVHEKGATELREAFAGKASDDIAGDIWRAMMKDLDSVVV